MTLVGAFNQEKALVGAFSVIVQPVVEPMDSFTALPATIKGGDRGRAHAAHRANIVLQVVGCRGISSLLDSLITPFVPTHKWWQIFFRTSKYFSDEQFHVAGQRK